jgi:hypothetical protein
MKNDPIRCYGKLRCRRFLDSIPLARGKIIAA